VLLGKEEVMNCGVPPKELGDMNFICLEAVLGRASTCT
jgi:hypothetical protein